MRKTSLLLLPAAVVLLAACQPKTPAEPAAPAPEAPAAAPAPAADAPVAAPLAANAELKPTQGSQTSGMVTFAVVDGGIRATGEVRGLPPGTEHGFHVHEKGDCSAPDATSAGGHFNPASSEHGRVGHGTHHGGDSDNILANDQGVAMVDTLLQGVTLGDGAATDILGKGVIVHADPDDYTTQPTGNAGARLACGVIAAAQ
ncbi:MAG: superoxide dismutase family protein [Proteobacteria bacterium]|nr:superoxide dismutase family protein [Pseudomonadota bacterium]